MKISQAIEHSIQSKNMSTTDMESVMHNIMTGACTDSQIAGFLIALRCKGESIDEITAAANVMRSLSKKVHVNGQHLVDIVGTGGDSTNTFNISTASSFVISACGGTVAKHGNRSVSSKSGSADLLELAGVKLDLNSDQVSKCINNIGIGFMFAPMHHSAMKHAITARKEMGVRTIFNILGPLTNPARVTRQLTGVFNENLVEPMAQVLKNLGSEQVMVVSSQDGMDEISICAPTSIAELKHGKVTSTTINPEQFGFERAKMSDIQVNSSKESLDLILEVFNNVNSPAKDIVCLNAGAAIYVAGITDTIEDGVIKAQTAIQEGLALRKLEQLISISNQV